MDLVYNTGLRFNSVYVVESLAPDNLRTGQELYDSVLLPISHSLDSFYTEYRKVESLPDLELTLSQILRNCQQYNHGPILHLEAHGSSSGLELADGTFVPWTDITPRLAQINQACRMNLLVMAMMCEGWDLTLSLMPSDRAPVFALVGPPEVIAAGAIEEATKRFYRAMLTDFDLNRALEAMNDHADFAKWPIRPATAEILFCRVFRFYLADYATPEGLQDRENEMVANMVRTHNLDLIQAAQFRQFIRGHLHDHEALYNVLRRPFLMLDLFPENESRFGLTYKDCVPVAA